MRPPPHRPRSYCAPTPRAARLCSISSDRGGGARRRLQFSFSFLVLVLLCSPFALFSLSLSSSLFAGSLHSQYVSFVRCRAAAVNTNSQKFPPSPISLSIPFPMTGECPVPLSCTPPAFTPLPCLYLVTSRHASPSLAVSLIQPSVARITYYIYRLSPSLVLTSISHPPPRSYSYDVLRPMSVNGSS